MTKIRSMDHQFFNLVRGKILMKLILWNGTGTTYNVPIFLHLNDKEIQLENYQTKIKQVKGMGNYLCKWKIVNEICQWLIKFGDLILWQTE